MVDGVVYAGAQDGVFRKLDASTGVELGAIPLGEVTISAPVLTGTTAYTLSGVGTVFAVDRTIEGFDILTRLEIDSNSDAVYASLQFAYVSPAVIGGRIFVVDAAGSIAAFGDMRANVPIREGMAVEVVAEEAHLRAAPSTMAVTRGLLQAGTRLQVTDSAEERGGEIWWPVEAEGLGAGWIRESVIVAAEVPPTATPTRTPAPPTSTPWPTSTPLPPTNTPIPTNTPWPTITPVPPTATVPMASLEDGPGQIVAADIDAMIEEITARVNDSEGTEVIMEAVDSRALAQLASGSWQEAGGRLINDGSSAIAEPWLQLALVPGSSFAIEAELRVTRLLDTVCDQSFGLTGGVAETGQVFGGGLHFPCGAETPRARLTNAAVWRDGYNADPLLAEEPFDLVGGWHTYRFELRGEQLRLLIDGVGVVTTMPDSQLNPAVSAVAGIWTQGVGLEVRRVPVFSIGRESESTTAIPLYDLLPTQAQMPPGLLFADEAERSKAEVVDSLGGTNGASQLLDDWGWSGNAHRDFIADETTVAPGGTTFLNASVHRFANAESAADAMVFLSDQLIFGQGLQEVEPPAIGDAARLLVGPSGDAMLAVLYAQQGPFVFRIGGSAPATTGDPTIDVLAVAHELIETDARREGAASQLPSSMATAISLATAEPTDHEQLTVAQATVEAQGTALAVAHVEAAARATELAVLHAQQSAAQVTATALAEVAAESVLNPEPHSITISTDVGGILAGTESALAEASDRLSTELSLYPIGCRAGFTLISGNAPTVEHGIRLAQRVEDLLREVRADIFTDATGVEHFALPGEPPFGEVSIDIFFYSGCEPIG